MSTVVHIVGFVVLIAVVLWAFVFGGIGIAIARIRGKSAASGFGWGFFLGPIGWIVLIFARPETSLTGGMADQPGWTPPSTDSGNSSSSYETI